MLPALMKKLEFVEDKWLVSTGHYIQSLFSDAVLPSHDYMHHLRVWNFAKQLLKVYTENASHFTTPFIEALFFACMFHDTGLVKTLREDHGAVSAGIARKYLDEHLALDNIYKDEVMSAIHRHDDKTYLEIRQNQIPGLYEILTVADDMDALGALGLMRYLEIYIRRNVSVENIKEKIGANLRSRFKFLTPVVEQDNVFFTCHKDRFELAQMLLESLSDKEIQTIGNSFIAGEFIPEAKQFAKYPALHLLISRAREEYDLYHQISLP